VLASERLFLRPLAPNDYPALYELEVGRAESVFFRHRGVSVSPDQYSATLWQGALVHYLACDGATGAMLGLHTCYSADMRNGYARIATILDPASVGLGWPLESAELFIDYLFQTFPFRKLYGDILEFNGAALAAHAHPLMHEEARLRQHEYHGGQYWDLITLAIYRDEWEASRHAGGARAQRLRAILADV
jgi:RimJ/RimL family protein N-acetyltransferase